MKRLQSLTIKGTSLKPNFFNLMRTSNSTYIAYTWKLQAYEKIYMVRNEMELPYCDVYEMRAQHRTGNLCGYAFDLFCKTPIINTNFIIASQPNNSNNFSYKYFKENKLNLSVKFRLKGCTVYAAPSVATMLTLSVHPTMKTLLDI